ncbi:MAG: DNA polymerase III subunit beta [Candidatus Megaira endosymbiont of Carteria cerasiformis]|nr:DNA polymerase III subunit beta [Candidatus Megaera polyxenophila]MCC8460476.1 DNA polymerase III subunit beta [Candidatus Megaera polyxenophila]
MSKNVNNNSLEIIVQTKELAYVLSFAASVVEKRNVVSELSNVKLVARDGILEIGATDLDLYLNQTIGAEVKKEGQSTVSTQILSEIVRKIPDKEISLKQDAGSEHLHVIGNSCKFDLLTLPASNFPQMEDLEAEVSLKVNCEEFARIVEYTSFAMSNEETRYNLNGIYLHVKNGEFLSAATDAHRFSIASSKIEANINDFGVIIPKKTVVELLKIVKDTKNIHSDISVTLGANKVKFACNNLLLMSKLIDGNFPEYESFIPTSNESKLIINTKLLASAIDRVATVTVDKFRAIKILLNDTCLAITATGEAKGAANESINFSDHKESYCSFSGNNLTIGFNPRYIMDVLGTLKEEQVHIYLNDASSPALIKTLENPRDSFVVMPVKV